MQKTCNLGEFSNISLHGGSFWARTVLCFDQWECSHEAYFVPGGFKVTSMRGQIRVDGQYLNIFNENFASSQVISDMQKCKLFRLPLHNEGYGRVSQWSTQRIPFLPSKFPNWFEAPTCLLPVNGKFFFLATDTRRFPRGGNGCVIAGSLAGVLMID